MSLRPSHVNNWNFHDVLTHKTHDKTTISLIYDVFSLSRIESMVISLKFRWKNALFFQMTNKFDVAACAGP